MGLYTQFIGVDEEAFGDGSTDTQPIDTWLQNRLSLNMGDVIRRPLPICFSPVITNANDFTTIAGIRPYAASDWHTVWLGRVLVPRGCSAYNVTLVYHSQVPGAAGTQAGDVQARVVFGDGSIAEATLAPTYSTGTKTGHQTLFASFKTKSPSDTEFACRIEVKSVNNETDVGAEIGSLGDGTSSNIRYAQPWFVRETQDGGGNEFWVPNSAGTAPDGDSLECMHWKTNALGTVAPNRTGSQALDLLFTEDLSANGSSAGTVQQVPIDISASSGAANMHQCFFLRGVMFEPVMSAASFYVIDRARLSGNLPLEDDEALKLALLTRQAYFRPRTMFVGPRGKKKSNTAGNTTTDMDTLDYYDYAAHWPFVMGDYDGTTTGQETDLINEMVWLETENPDVEVVCTWISVQHGVSYPYNVDLSGDRKKAKGDKFDKAVGFTDTGSLTGSADWTMAITFDQMDDVTSGTAAWGTNSTEYGSVDDTVSIPVWAADLQNAQMPPVLRGVDGFEQNGKGTGSPPSFWFKEGSLFEKFGDLAVRYETIHTFRAANTTNSITRWPFRLKMTMTLDDFVDPLNEDGTDAEKNAKLRLMLVSCTVRERPVEP